jgi:putative N6-adenine-specific DNA methylase
MSEVIHLAKTDFKDLIPQGNSGVIIMNPPYGQRIKTGEETNLYSLIGSTLKHKFTGFNAWLITSDKEGLKNIGLKPALRKHLFNGSLECVLAKYELYQGSKKA